MVNKFFSGKINVPGYEVGNILGKGSMSRVFFAKSLKYDSDVALKIIYSQNRDDIKFLRQFMQEYMLLSNINHPNIVNVYDHGFVKDFAYIAMEYYSGGLLLKKLSNHGIKPKIALDYLEQITFGLSEIHRLNIIHRDIKPSSILVKANDILGLADFGIARNMFFSSNNENLGNMIVGTPHYMSPEQGIGEEIDERSDFYSLGIMFYEMLMGEKPFVADNMADVLMLHTYAPIPRLNSDTFVCQPLINGLLAKDPNERFTDARKLLANIRYIKSKF